MSDIVHVAVAVIVNERNEVCISLRHKDAHQGDLWEFPGGKIEADESVSQALSREIKEELGLVITDTRPLITIPHKYKDRKVCLHVQKVLSYRGEATGLEGQDVKWVTIDKLSSYDFPTANEPIINAIQLPDKYLITGKFESEDDYSKKLSAALDSGIKLVQLRLKSGDLTDKSAKSIIQQSSTLCRQAGAKLLINIPENILNNIDLAEVEFCGFHADSRKLKTLDERPEGLLFSASCHNVEELAKARKLQADFVVLSPVQKTASHPEMDAMGWENFTSIVEECEFPVFALGGVSDKDRDKAWRHGAQGVAAISAFWK